MLPCLVVHAPQYLHKSILRYWFAQRLPWIAGLPAFCRAVGCFAARLPGHYNGLGDRRTHLVKRPWQHLQNLPSWMLLATSQWQSSLFLLQLTGNYQPSRLVRGREQRLCTGHMHVVTQLRRVASIWWLCRKALRDFELKYWEGRYNLEAFEEQAEAMSCLQCRLRSKSLWTGFCLSGMVPLVRDTTRFSSRQITDFWEGKAVMINIGNKMRIALKRTPRTARRCTLLWL